MSIISLIDNGSFSSFKSIIVIGGTLHQKLNSRVQWFNKDLNHHKRESYCFDTPCTSNGDDFSVHTKSHQMGSKFEGKKSN